MSFLGSSPPPPPSGAAVAAAQGQTNIDTAIATLVMSNVNEVSPEATVTYTQPATYSLIIPQYNPTTGLQVGTTTRSLPITTRTVAYQTQPQRIFEKGLDAKETTADLLTTQLTQINSQMSQTFNTVGLRVRGDVPATPTLNPTITAATAVTTALTLGDLVTHVATTRDAIYARLLYDNTVERDATTVRLANKGIPPGTEAYRRAMTPLDRQLVDARNQAYLSAAQEQTRIVQLEVVKAQFANEAQQQQFQQSILIIDFANNVNLKRLDSALALNNYIDSLREDELKERILVRTQALNEMSALMHGSQVQIPNFQPFRGGAVAQTPIAESMFSSYEATRANYFAKQQTQQGLFGGILGLTANLIGGGIAG